MLSLKYLSSIRKNDSKVLVIPLDGKPRLMEDKKNTTPHKLEDDEDDTFLKNIIGTEITSFPCDEYDIFSAKNGKENRLAESILKNAIYGEHNPNGFDAESDVGSCTFYTHSNRSSRYGFLCGTVVVVGNCGTW